MVQVRDEGSDSGSLIAFYFFFKILPVLVGAGSIYLGYRLFILGVTGQASLTVQSGTISGQLLNAAPGLIFAIGGFVMVIFAILKSVSVTRPGRRLGRKT